MPHDLLAGIRVIDLTWGWAGPAASMMAADMGAEVIKVEAPGHLDWWRWAVGGVGLIEREQDCIYELSARFNSANRDKLGVVLDFGHPRGREVLLKLLAVSDAVIMNLAPRVVRRLRLDYDSLREANPKLLVLSMTGMGMDGPWSDMRGYAVTMQAMGGITALTGYEHEPPQQPSAIGDGLSGLNGGFALLLGLLHRERTGQGLFIDMSCTEGLASMVGDAVLAASHKARPRLPLRMGNSHLLHAPRACYPCHGEDRWVAIAVTSDQEWGRLVGAMGRPAWARGPGLAHAEQRVRRRAHLDRRIAEWTGAMTVPEVVAILEQADVKVAAVAGPMELLAEKQLRERGFWQEIDRPFAGCHPYPTTWMRFAGRPNVIGRAGPLVGQDNHHVAERILGMSPVEVDELERQGIMAMKSPSKGSRG